MVKLSFLLLALTASGCLLGNPVVVDGLKDKEALQMIFHKDFLDAPDNELLDLAVCKVLATSEHAIAPSLFKEQFKDLASLPDVEKRFLSLYASILNEQELEDACSLLEDERYLKLRKKLGEANFLCFQESATLLEELALITQSVENEKPKNAIVHVREDNIEELLNSSTPLIIDVYTDWCGPCKYLAVVMKELNHEYAGTYQFAKLNAEHEKELATSFGIRAYPTVLFFKNGKEVGRSKGFMSKEKFLKKIALYFKNEEVPKRKEEEAPQQNEDEIPTQDDSLSAS